MKWETEWWGVMIIAETEQDEKVLRDLYNLLPKDPVHGYEEATIEIYNGNNNETILELRR